MGRARLLHDEALWQGAGCTTLFADVDPNQKERIILALRKCANAPAVLS